MYTNLKTVLNSYEYLIKSLARKAYLMQASATL